MDFNLSQGRQYTFRPSDDLGHYQGMHDGVARRDEFAGYDAATQMRLKAERDSRNNALKGQVLGELPPMYKALLHYHVRIDNLFLHQANGRDLTRSALVVYALERNVSSYVQNSGSGIVACVLKYVPGSNDCLIAAEGLYGIDVERVDISQLYAFNEGKWPDLLKWQLGSGKTLYRLS